MNAQVPRDVLIRPAERLLPNRLEQLLRQILKPGLDSFTGNVILNIKDGRVLGFHKVEIVQLPATEI